LVLYYSRRGLLGEKIEKFGSCVFFKN